MTNSGNGVQIDLNLWLTRLIAYIIDAVIIIVVSVIIGVIIAISIVLTGPFFLFVGYGLFFFIFGILSLLYFIISDVAWGGTIGKRAMGLQVQTVNGGRIDIAKSFIRNISKIFWLFLILDWLIAVVTAGNDRRQKLTDRWAGTTVIQLRKSPIQFTTSPTALPTSSPPPTAPA